MISDHRIDADRDAASPRHGTANQGMRMKLDQKTELHYRQVAMNMACANHGEGKDPDAVVASAEKYFAFMAGNTMSADPGQMLVHFRRPSGVPNDWLGCEPLPADTIDSVMVADVTTPELQEMRRVRLFELDVLSNTLKSRGVVPN